MNGRKVYLWLGLPLAYFTYGIFSIMIAFIGSGSSNTWNIEGVLIGIALMVMFYLYGNKRWEKMKSQKKLSKEKRKLVMYLVIYMGIAFVLNVLQSQLTFLKPSVTTQLINLLFSAFGAFAISGMIFLWINALQKKGVFLSE